ncbi:hypothetical protein PVAP13_1NG457219, partial [Panicum virgatum]
GRLNAFSVQTTQGEWNFDVSTITGAAVQPSAGVDARTQPSSAAPQPPDAHNANVVKISYEPPAKIVQQSLAESSSARDLPQCDDDDDFMEPLPRRPVTKKQCVNASVADNATGKPAKNPVKYAHAPTVRCAPSAFNSFVDHLTFNQRMRIKEMGFGGLLHVSADRLESRELLKFLLDRLDPSTMVINISKDKGIHVTPYAVMQVLGLPDSGEHLHFHSHNQAYREFSAFKAWVGLEKSQDMHASHLQNILEDDSNMGSAMIDDDMEIRFFFIIACNKLLFPSTDNNIRCKDVYLTRDLTCLPGLNWWKILYLDNLQCKHQIAHTETPRAKYFDQNVIKRIITADRMKDRQGKATFGLLPVRSFKVPVNIDLLAATHFSSMQAEVHSLVAQNGTSLRKTQVMLVLANFEAKSKKASSYMNIGLQILRDAHQAAVHTLRTILHDEVNGNINQQHHDQTHACDEAQADDVDMHDNNSLENRGSEHEFDMPISRSEGNIEVPTDVTITPVVPLRAAEGDTGPSLPIDSTHDNVQEATSHVDSLLGVTDAYTTITSPRQTAKQVPDEVLIYHLSFTRTSSIFFLHFCQCTYDNIFFPESVNHRPQRLTKRPAMYVSPFKGDPQRATVPLSKALAVRKKFKCRMKCLREFSGSDILASFIDGEKMLCTGFMSYFVSCMSHDESVHMIDGGGYRVFLSLELGDYVNIEEGEGISQWESPQALAILQRDIEHVDPNKVKLFLLPVMEEDVLDSSPEDHKVYHQVLGDRIIHRLNLLFQLATNSPIKQFTRFKHPIIDICSQTRTTDCGFYALKFMELWNGESFHFPILTENIWQYKSQLLFYGIYHPINKIQKLPAGLE